MDKSGKSNDSCSPRCRMEDEGEDSPQRQEILELKNILKVQHHIYFNQTANHDLLLERIITKLTLLHTDSHPNREEPTSALNTVIEFCTKQLCAILQSHQKLRTHWDKVMQGISGRGEDKQFSSGEKCTCNWIVREYGSPGLGEQNSDKIVAIEYLEAEVEELYQKYEEILQENRNIKQEYASLLIFNAEQARKIDERDGTIHSLTAKSEELTLQLKEAKDTANKQAQAWLAKLHVLQQQNQAMSEHQSRANHNELRLNRIIDQNEKEIQKVCEEVHRLNLEIVAFQIKFKQAVDREARTRTDHPNRRTEAKILCEIPTQNTIDSVQSMASRRQLDKMRKLHLQSVQEKLSSCHLFA